MSLQLEASDFAFADVDSIRSPNFLPGAARFQDLPGLVASSGASVQMTGASDQLARFHKCSAPWLSNSAEKSSNDDL
ncbi:MAG: hypothetical protein R3C56_04905 [Pirellulaceae bacterium]